MTNDLLNNLDKIHTTELGEIRIKRNLNLEVNEASLLPFQGGVVEWCKNKIKQSANIKRQGKNWYVEIEGAIITVNAYSYTIITAHKKKL